MECPANTGVAERRPDGRRVIIMISDLIKAGDTEGKEKHVPEIEVIEGGGRGGKDIVRVVVGKEVPHPNLLEHHIVWIELYGVKENGMVIDIGRASFGPSFTEPSGCFHVDTSQFKQLCALSYCNIHGVWQDCLDL